MIHYLSLADALFLVDELGVGPVRDLGMLESTMHRPRAAFLGQELYPSLDQKAAALLESLVINQALADGNKRLAWLAISVFYDLNGVDLDVDEDAAYDLVIAAAAGELSGKDLVDQLSELRAS